MTGIRVLSGDDVRRLVPMADAVVAVRDAFVGLRRGEFEQPVRTSLGDGRMLVMPVLHLPSGEGVVKSLVLDFTRDPAITGTVTWTHPSRGQLVADAVAVTSLRTGAVVGAATDLLAPADASALVLFGAGGQAFDQVMAVAAVRGLEQVSVVAPGSARAALLVDRLRTALPDVRVEVSTQARAALAGADVVCCATPARAPLFAADDLPARVHVNAIGAFTPQMCELPSELLGGALVVVDELAAALVEAGDVLQAIEAGALAPGDLVELGAILLDPPSVRPDRTVFKSVGLAAQDWAIAHLLAERA